MLRAKWYWARRYLPVRCWYRYAGGKMVLGQKIFASKKSVPIANRYQARRYLPVKCGCIDVPVSKRYRVRRHLPIDCRYRHEGTGTVPCQYWQTVYGMYGTNPVGADTGTILAYLLGPVWSRDHDEKECRFMYGWILASFRQNYHGKTQRKTI